MAVNSSLGAEIYISSAPVLPTVDSVTEFKALTWVKIGEAESLGEIGDESNAITFTGLSDGRVRNLKGARNSGSVPLVVGHDPLDAGQLALIAAEASRFSYGFKLVIPDAPGPTYSDSVHYWRAMVMSKRIGAVNTTDVAKRTFNLGVNSEIFEAVAAVSP